MGTAEKVKAIKMEHFLKCATVLSESFYFFAIQPIYDVDNRMISAEILLRCRNGQDSAPFEDVIALMNPEADADVQDIYATWKVYEIVDFCLHSLKTNQILARNIIGLSSNVRPMDMNPQSVVYKKLVERLAALSDEDRIFLFSNVI